ncbi:MAG: NUDIX hydrolase [Inquilinaceae bacterium]
MMEYTVSHNSVSALIVDEQRRYLLQLRDDVPSIRFPGHWGLFGGSAEPDEALEAALIRELSEELSFEPSKISQMSEIFYRPAYNQNALYRKTFFVVPVVSSEIGQMVQREGQSMKLHRFKDVLRLPDIIPTDLYGILTYEHHMVPARARA